MKLVRNKYHHATVMQVIDEGEQYYVGYILPNYGHAVVDLVPKAFYQPIPNPNQMELPFP